MGAMVVLHRENALCVGLLGAIHKKMNYILKTFPCCARGLHHLIENGGTIWRKMPIFKEEKCVWLAILYKHSQRCAHGLYHLIEKLG